MRLGILFLLITLVACNQLDPYLEPWKAVAVGDSKNQVLAVMGEPAEVLSLEVPIVTSEKMMWVSYSHHRQYTVVIVLDRVVSKAVSQ